MKIRKATKKDIEVLNQFSDDLHMLVSRVTGIKISRKQLDEEHIKSEKELKEDNYYVAEEGGIVVGCVIFSKKTGEDEWKGDYIELHHIIVSESYRGKGVGKALVDFVKSYAKKRKANIKADTNFANSEAIAFYEKMEFKPLGLEMVWRLE